MNNYELLAEKYNESPLFVQKIHERILEDQEHYFVNTQIVFIGNGLIDIVCNVQLWQELTGLNDETLD